MNKIFTSLTLALASASMSAQVMLSQDFPSTFTPAAAGWTIQNNSVPTGTSTWAQGNPQNFNSFNGPADAYYSVGFSSAGGTGDISNWLITPTVTIYDGAVVQFATRTAGPVQFPDRLQLRMSQTAGAAIPTGTANVGNFTDLLLDINPNLTTVAATAVNNGTVDGYPSAWTVYSVQISGVTGTVTGHFALRYLVTNSGPSGTNGNLIGIDAFRYTLPCGPVVNGFTTCAGENSILTALNGLPATTYSWSTGATTQSIAVNPNVTTTYTLYPSVGGSVACGNTETVTITIGSAPTLSATANANTVCAGNAVTLTATSPASNIQWINSSGPIGAGPVVTVFPSGVSDYSVIVGYGTFPFFTCTNVAHVTISSVPVPTVSVSGPTLLCRDQGSVAISFTASGANDFLWVVGNAAAPGSTVTINAAALTPTSPAKMSQTIGLLGQSNGCIGTTVHTIVLVSNPNIEVTSSSTLECIQRSYTVSATGADSYTWSEGTSTTGTQTLQTGTVPGTKTITATGTNTDGCTASGSTTISVEICSGIQKLEAGSFSASVFPNPFSDKLQVTGLNGTVVIYNSLGQSVVTEKVSGATTLSTQHLPAGVYIVNALNENGEIIKTSRLIRK